LLVSVRNLTEAIEAVAGGCDLLDVKEPLHGPLGRADGAVLREIVEAMCRRTEPVAVSAALGEVQEWLDPPSWDARGLRRLTYAKLGLSGLRSVSDWPLRFHEVRNRIDALAEKQSNWIAVAYADADAADAPELEEVVAAAIAQRCAGLLVDTWSKGDASLTDLVSPERLRDASLRSQQAGLLFAAAGRLQTYSLARLREVPLDIVGIRSAACRDGLRGAAVESELVARFRREIMSAFGAPDSRRRERARQLTPKSRPQVAHLGSAASTK
jgi:uncharacterized protein (UPF0264 family)